jgi:hypothetical protein
MALFSRPLIGTTNCIGSGSKQGSTSIVLGKSVASENTYPPLSVHGRDRACVASNGELTTVKTDLRGLYGIFNTSRPAIS